MKFPRLHHDETVPKIFVWSVFIVGLVVCGVAIMTFWSARVDFYNAEQPVPPPVTGPGQSKPVPPPVTPREPSFPFETSHSAISHDIVHIVASSSPVFAYAHGTVLADNRLFIGMANRNGNVFSSRRLVVFPDLMDLSIYDLLTLPVDGEVNTMIYDTANDMIYFAASGNGGMYIYALNPHNLGLSMLIGTTTLDLGRKPAIVTDGAYIYGITETVPAIVFKLGIADHSLALSREGHIKNGHSATIGLYGSSTELYFGGGMYDGFEKVSAQNLHSLGTLDLAPCLISDDMPAVPIGPFDSYIYIGCESVPFGYRIRTSDLSVTQFPLPGKSLGMFSDGPYLFNAAEDGYLDLFPNHDLGTLTRYYVANDIPTENTSGQNLQLNEIFYATSTDSVYFTAWWGVPGVYQLSHL